MLKINKIAKHILLSLVFSCLLCCLYVFYLQQKKCYVPNYIMVENQKINQDVLLQLRFLKKELHEKNGAEAQQNLYPEGFVFANALYGLAWINFAENLDKNSSLFSEAKTESRWAYEQIITDESRAVFNPNLPLIYGAFYRGWSNYLLSKHLLLETNQIDSSLLNTYVKNCVSIKYTLNLTQKTYIESYENQTWAADNVLCLASLRNYKRLTQSDDYEPTVIAWLSKIKTHLDSNYQLVPHFYDLKKEKGIAEPRGSSQSLMNCFWIELDSAFAKKQFDIYKKEFLSQRLGFKAVREYPQQIDKQGDIDSGPVIWGIGAAASVVGVRALASNGDTKNATQLSHSIECFGFPSTDTDAKKYLGANILMLDLFRVWTLAKK